MKKDKQMLELREKLAEIEHTRWSDWQKYLHDKCSRHPDGLLISKSDVDHWERQIKTPYSKLSEQEKDSDREQVDRYLGIVDEFISKALAEQREEICNKFDRKMLKTKGEFPDVVCNRGGYNNRVQEEWQIIEEIKELNK